jgi:hypothetical protein
MTPRSNLAAAAAPSASKWPFVILGLMVGALVSVLVVQIASAFRSRDRGPVAVADDSEPTAARRTPRARAAVDRPPPRWLEPAASSPAAGTRTAPGLGAEERRAAFAATIAAHAREPLDATWARQTAALVDSGLAASGTEGGYVVRGVDCRSQTCVAELEWPSYELAAEGYQSALTASFGRPCATEIVIPEPIPAGGSHRAQLHVRCR